MQTLPAAGTFSDIAATLKVNTAMSVVGTTLTIQAQLFKYRDGSVAPIPGASCLFAPLTGVVAAGTPFSCTTTDLNIPYAAGMWCSWL